MVLKYSHRVEILPKPSCYAFTPSYLDCHFSHSHFIGFQLSVYLLLLYQLQSHSCPLTSYQFLTVIFTLFDCFVGSTLGEGVAPCLSLFDWTIHNSVLSIGQSTTSCPFRQGDTPAYHFSIG